ncbi:probable RNA-binding protein 19 isoform X3 [Daphnia pulex]|uniref:probable RNA-binding protein 19 isoform X3 n=1 Tax=Daphnia pulex TaxID=6669 RepID=UPI001EDDDC20|nr:probable RNA-binding protein 19 isoform X3 [Daphnia pulex]
MTRIIVKNLPPSVSAQKLKETFSQKGQVTDVQLKYDKDGKFRHFGFVGFKNDDEADSALSYFNNTFVGSCKIQVERCVNLGESSKMKKGKRAPEAIPAPLLTQKVNPVKEDTNKTPEDPEFAEFREIHSHNQKDKIWDNDGIDGSVQKPISSEDASDAKEENLIETIAHKKDLSDLEYLKSKVVGGAESSDKPVKLFTKKEKAHQDYMHLKVRGFSCQVKKKDIKEFFAPLKLDSIRLPPKVKGVAYIGFSSEKDMKKALNKHRSFYAGNRISVVKSEKKIILDEEPKSQTKNEAWERQENDMKKEETVAESGRIFIRNLAYTATEEDIEALFSRYGPLAETHLPIDKHSRKIKGFAFVTYVIPEHAVRAYTALDGTAFQGRMLHLIAGKPKATDDDDADGEGTSYKKKKLKDLKNKAASAHNWNTLFLGTNAVATLMAERYSTTKQQVLLEGGDGQQQSVAVRLALGETQLVAETKQFLVDNGIHLDAFQDAPKQRSKTVMLVKNLDAQSNVDELRDLFSPFGELGRVLLPPRGVTAIVEFLEPTEAKAAFRKLAYSKFRHMPLYLEWAPMDVFRTAAQRVESKPSENKTKVKDASAVATLEENNPIPSDKVEEQPEQDTTVFVKNVNFATTDQSMRKHFESCGPIFSATVARKKDPKNPGQFLSMGYGFVQFLSKKATVTALKELQNSTLDGHTIELKRSNRTENKEETIITARKTLSTTKEPISSKLLVRNIPFEATTKEVTELFKPFGELKAVRLPKKMAGNQSHRGFAFIDFITKQDAKRAFESLSASTHLYGRRLVLEWAASEDTVEDVRRRTTSHYTEGPPTKRNKKLELPANGIESD